jgi:cytoskeletal protein RodZ
VRQPPVAPHPLRYNRCDRAVSARRRDRNADQMPSVGEILSAERRRQGKQIADVVERTKIRSRLLEALEEGRYDDLPSPAYVKGYIQAYARYLEIPSEPLLEQFKAESASTVRRLAPADRYLAEIPVNPIVPKRGAAHEIPRRVWIVAAAGIVLVVLLLCALSQCGGPSTGANTTPTSVPATQTAAPATATTTTAPAAAGFKLRVSVRAGLASTVKVTVDGLIGFNGTMQSGESQEFQVADTAALVIGTPAAVVVTRDGQPVTLPSTANAQLTLTAKQ